MHLALRLAAITALLSVSLLVFTSKSKQLFFQSDEDRDGTSPHDPSSLPSTLIMRKSSTDPPWPVISLHVDPVHLLGPKGLYLKKHLRKRGKAWERPGAVSFYENGRLLFQSEVGVRLHGGKGANKRRNSSFRLYFRKEYGAKYAKKGVFLAPEIKLRKLVIRKDTPLFMTPFTFEIVRRVGAIAPAYKQARFFMNGEAKGFYTLIEHLNKKQWTHRMGRKEDFLFTRMKGKKDPEAKKKMDRFFARWRDETKKVSLKSIRKSIDIDNWTRSLFALLYCNTKDYAQGALIRDIKGRGKWFWVNWDMDVSMRSASENTFETMQENKPGLRPLLFFRLMKESAEYRRYFSALATELLNHALKEENLYALLSSYRRQFEKSCGIGKYLNRYKKFVKRRRAALMTHISDVFSFGPPTPVKVEGPMGVQFSIDSYIEHGPYEGLYFKGQTITVQVSPEYREEFSHWLVNGERFDNELLRRRIEDVTVVQFVPK